MFIATLLIIIIMIKKKQNIVIGNIGKQQSRW